MGQNSASIRVGRISSINYKAGTVRVTYADRDDMVTKEIPLLSFEYMMPRIGDIVQVNHLSNGAEMGVVMGQFWSNINRPFEGKEGLWRKELSNIPDKAFMRYAEDEKETATVKIPNIIVKGYKDGEIYGSITIEIGKSIIEMTKDEINIKAHHVNIHEYTEDEWNAFSETEREGEDV